MYQNHVIDPTYFYDAINEFSFDYKLYRLSSKNIDEYGRRINSYTLESISGSLQSQGTQLIQSTSGNTRVKSYEFYCKSLYRIDIGDVIEYKGNYLMCKSVNDYDEYGVRRARLELISLTTYRDLADYVKYLEGQKLV